jgi:hypothetical protein
MSKIDKVVKWLKQPSSVRAVIILAGIAGYTVTPEVIAAAGALLGLYELFRDEDKQIKTTSKDE